MLRLLNAGVDLTAVVTQLAMRYGVKPTTIYKDHENIAVWGPNYKEQMRSADEIYSWFNELSDFTYKVLKEQALTGDNSNARVGAAKALLDLGFRRIELSQSMGITQRVPTGIEVSGRMVTEIVDKSNVWLDAMTEEMQPDEIKMLLKNVARAKSAAENR